MKKKMDVNYINKQECSILINCLEDNIELVKYLIEKKNMNIYHEDEDGYTILHLMCESNFVIIVKYLIEDIKMDINHQNNYFEN